MQELLLKIKKCYGLELTFLEKVTKGYLSENYILTDGASKYFLKKYRFEDQKRIEEIHSVKKYFAHGGIPVILPSNLASQETFFVYGGAYYTLFPFVNGKQYERGSLTVAPVSSLGAMLGHIHLVGKDAPILTEKQFNFKIDDKEKILEKVESILEIITTKKTLDDFDKVAIKNIELKKQLIISNSFVKNDMDLPSDHLIHGDYLDHNVFFDKEDKVSHVFDFEKTTHAPRVFELLRSMVYSLLSESVTSRDLKLAKIYLQAYKDVYPISKKELETGLQLFWLRLFHSFWVESEHYLKGNNRVDLFLYSDYARIKYFSEHFDDVKNILIN